MIDPDRADRIYEFGPFRVDTGQRQLTRAGQPLPLTPKAFETLIALLRSGGRVVRKDDLMKRVWPDAIVEEANLARHVYALRKVLGDDNDEPAYIQTVSKLGYKFVAPVRDASADEQPNLSPAPANSDVQPDVPATAAPDRQVGKQARLRPVTFILFLLLVGLASVGLSRFWRDSASPAEPADRLIFLTDGSHDDNGASWTKDGRIYFSRFVSDTRYETWTMNGDGTNQRRANSEIKTLLAGRWSPDGTKVVFTKETDSRPVAYLADADGGHEIMLPFVSGNLDWSPDGSEFVYQERTSRTRTQLSIYNVGTGKVTTLTPPDKSDADPSFSPDGTRIAFVSWRDGTTTGEIYVMQTDGSSVRRVTNNPAFDQYPVFSPDGTQLAFQSNREDEHFEIYLQNLDDNTPPVRLTRSSTGAAFAPKCWSPDGTRMLVYTNRHGKDQVAVIEVDPYPSDLVIGDSAAELSHSRLSSDGRLLAYEALLADRSLELRVTNLDTNQTTAVFRTEPDYPPSFHLAPAWAPGNSLIAFTARVGGNSEIFSIAPDGRGLRNLTQNPLRDSSPAFSADGREIFFDRDAFGHGRLYRMDTNGGGQRRVTSVEEYESQPAASLDGRHLAYAGDRDGRGFDIFVLDLDRPSQGRPIVARPAHEGAPAFSPDGRRVAFVATSDGNPEIYLVNVDGTGLFRLTHSKQTEAAPHFSLDGRDVLFSSNRGGRFAIHRIQLR